MRFLICITLAFGFVSPLLMAQTKRIVTYIDDVQDERRSTRRTLTEWLRIKERMKMMDLWLAVFSDPKNNKFAPELSLAYMRGGGDTRYDLGSAEGFATDKRRSLDKAESEDARLQFWFTNLVSSTTGLRTLDIDLGIEGKIYNRFNSEALTPADPTASWTVGTAKLQQGGLNLRIFGANTQDSTLVVKAGKFSQDLGLLELKDRNGVYYGGELGLYFLSFLGIEGNYYQYLSGKDKIGETIDAFAFLEIYNIRIGYGQAQRDWTSVMENTQLKIREKDRFVMMRLYF